MKPDIFTRLAGLVLSTTLVAVCGHPISAMGADNVSTPALKINQMQVIGTHNSYRSSISPAALAFLDKINPKFSTALDYAHADIPAQLNSGVRQIEIDIYADSHGNRYANPKGAEWEKKAGINPGPDDMHPAGMGGTDFKVMHILDLDQRANCEPLSNCLLMLRAWSESHPRHLPLFVDIETKQDVPTDKIPFSVPEKFTPATYDRLDEEVRGIIPSDSLIVPDQVRGHFATLNEAILHNNWPTVDQARGKIIFLFDRPADTQRYVKDHPSLKGRVFFTNSTPGQPEAAFTELNDDDPARHVETERQISELVRQGYLVRTRADANTMEARVNDTSRREAALRSGAQLVTTDYPQSEPAKWTGYSVTLPDHEIARCNPINAPSACSQEALKENVGH